MNAFETAIARGDIDLGEYGLPFRRADEGLAAYILDEENCAAAFVAMRGEVYHYAQHGLVESSRVNFVWMFHEAIKRRYLSVSFKVTPEQCLGLMACAAQIVNRRAA